jgi:hypothetical protein
MILAMKAVGSALLVLLVAATARRVNAELEAIRRERTAGRPVETLERDPATGEYRPRGR